MVGQANIPANVNQSGVQAVPVTNPVAQGAPTNISQGTPQNVQVPNYSGVNIQIFNPSVNAPGSTAQPATVNAPTYSSSPSYPANYYTQNLAQPQPQPQPVAPAEEKKKTEKRDVVVLTDEYLKNLENYLNNPNKDVRLMGAKEVLARIQEDDSRKDDPALTALVNKMLQDPYQPVKFIAMAALDARSITGDTKTVGLLKNIQQQKTNYGEDALKASNILLKLSSNTTQKEFEVKDKPVKAEKLEKAEKSEK